MIEKLCPILMVTKDGKHTCAKGDCAWWDGHYNCCAVLSSSILLDALTKRKNMQSKVFQESDKSENMSQK